MNLIIHSRSISFKIAKISSTKGSITIEKKYFIVFIHIKRFGANILKTQLQKYKRFVFAGFYSAIMLVVAMMSYDRFFYPLEIIIELKASHDEYCQIFYRNIKGFNEKQSVTKPYNSDFGFCTLHFILPPAFISGLRIDPGVTSEFYEINKIEVKTAKDSVKWFGSDIINEFRLVNLEHQSQNNLQPLLLTATRNPDGQIILKLPFYKKINLLNIPALISMFAIFLVVWIAGIVAIFFFHSNSNPIVTHLKQSCRFVKNKIYGKMLELKSHAEKLTFIIIAKGHYNNKVSPFWKRWLPFTMLCVVMLIDRAVTLIYFGFRYTDIDQTVMWNGALDYSQGVFHEPFFYGQNYNFMLESLMAVPLLWLNMPVYFAMPFITSIMSLIPYIFLALFFKWHKNNLLAYFSLVMPVLLPVEFNFLTTISRGFIQAHLFFPLLLIPIFQPTKPFSATVLFIISALCFIANENSAIIILPIFIWVYYEHFKSPAFYLKSLLVIPLFFMYFLGKYYYIIHPERVVYEISGLNPDMQIFLTNLNNPAHFKYLFPFSSNIGFLYPFLFSFFLLITLFESKRKESLFFLSILVFLLITFSIPKLYYSYYNAGIFYSPDRFYLFLPVLLILSISLITRPSKQNSFPVFFLLLLISLISFTIKNFNIREKAEQTISETSFPVAENDKLLLSANHLRHISETYKVSLIINATHNWDFIFDSYSFRPLTIRENHVGDTIISVNLNGDRRTWLYQDKTIYRQILLNGIKITDNELNTFEYEVLDDKLIIIKNNNLIIGDLFSKLEIHETNCNK